MTARRQDTEQSLQKAALQLLGRDGVLAGLNLRELADEAGVNRGLVYHYFGSRREILRSALRTDYRRRLQDVRSGGSGSLRARWTHFLRTMVRHRLAIRIATLLHLDRDPELRMMPIRHETRRLLERDQACGDLPHDLDLEALHAALDALVYGYALYRERFARELRRPVRELDRGVERTLERMLEGLAERRGRSDEEAP